VVAAAVTASLATASASSAATRSTRRVPQRLADTGLYSDVVSRTVHPRNMHYSPQYALWSDGAAKERWIYLPPGTTIDARNPEQWVFPVGTKLWKQFAWSRPVETRYLERTRQGWVYAVYVWAEDGSDAVLAPETGVLSSHEVASGRRHAIPSLADCLNCHRGGRAEILGFSALQLSPDRDPLAPHAEPVRDGDVNLATLVERGLVRGLPRDVLDPPPRIVASTPRGRAAKGYLHANCSGCHDSRGPLASVGVSLRHSLRARDERAQPATAAIGHPTRFELPGAAPGGSVWLAPGEPSSSAVVRRMQSRNPAVQMPPLATKLVDEEAVRLVREWIEQDLLPPSPEGDSPQPRRRT
jgi:mono/diheme cytochrome c family protein